MQLKSNYLLALALLTSVCGFAQQLFTDNFGGSKEDVCTGSILLPDRSNVMCGYTLSNDSMVSGNHGGSDGWVIKVNEDGQILWKKTFGGSKNDRLMSIALGEAGGFVLAGHTNSNDGNVSGLHGAGGKSDMWILAIDQFGNLKKQKCLGGTADDVGNSIVCIGSSYYACGSVASSNGDISTSLGSRDMWAVKLDFNLSLIWEKSFGGSANDDARKILVDGNRFLMVGVSASSNNDAADNNGLRDGIVIIGDTASGAKVSSRCIGGSLDDEFYSIKKIQSRYFAAGYARSGNGDLNNNKGNKDVMLFSFDATNMATSVNVYNYGGSLADVGQDVSPMGTDIAILATTASNNGDINGNHAVTKNDMALLKLDSNGVFKWSKCYGGSQNDVAIAFATDNFVVGTKFENLYMVGKANSVNGDIKNPKGGFDYVLVSRVNPRIDAWFGTQHADCPGDFTTCTFDYYGRFTNASNIYRLYLSDSSGNFANQTLLTSVASKSHFVMLSYQNPTDPQSYYYQKRVYCSNVNIYSDSNNVAPVVCQLPITTKVKVFNITTTTAKVSWTDVQSCQFDDNVIFYKEQNATLWSKLTVNTSLTQLTGLAPASKYTVKVRKRCNANMNIYSIASKPTTFTTDSMMLNESSKTINSDVFDLVTTGNNQYELIANHEREFDVLVLNLNGQIVKQLSNMRQTAMLSLDGLSAGIYIIRYGKEYARVLVE
ncbi:MAG: fibronectin type III domain-containing protein [Bacteroidetes bacterium]|nr:fibronectin type III domain-containing protein [Bacteroidota bacterium]